MDENLNEELLTDRAVSVVLRKVEKYALLTGLAESTIGRHALSDSMFIARVREGKNFQIDKMRRLELWLNENLRAPAPPKRGRPASGEAVAETAGESTE